MKILKENKEKLPISFLTDFISKSWEEVGYLKADIEAIKQSFKGTKDIEDLIQNLIDAYLVCIGQLESHISDKNYMEYPEESGLTKLEEDFELKVSNEGELVEIKADNLTDYEVKEEENKIVLLADNQEVSEEEIEKESEEVEEKTPAREVDAFEYFVDFDEPDMSEPRITDKDLYDEN